MKKLISIVLCVALIFSCASCTIEINTGGGKADSSSTSKPEPVPPKPLVKLECYGNDGRIVSLCDAGDNKILVLAMWGNPRAGTRNDLKFKLYMIDVEQDKLLYEKDIDGSDSILGVRKNGDYVMLNYDNMMMSVFDKDSNLVNTCSLSDGFYTLDRDGDCLYNNYLGTLKRVDFDGNEETLVSFKGGAIIETFNAKSGLLVLSGDGTNETNEAEYAVYSLKEKDFLYTGYNDCSNYYIKNDKIYLQTYRTVEDPKSNSNSFYTISAHDLNNDEDTNVYRVPEDTFFDFFDDTDIALSVRYKYRNNIMQGAKIVLADFSEGKYAELDKTFDKLTYNITKYIKSSNKFVIGMTDENNAENNSYIYVVAPEVIELNKNLKEYEHDKEPQKTYTLGKHLKKARKLANGYEEKYSVRILLGNECLNTKPNDNYSIISTENREYSTDEEYEVTTVNELLTTLSNALEKYSPSFFEAFKNYRDDGGLRFLIVKDLVNNEGVFEAAGLHYLSNAWYNIILDFDGMNEASIHHEIWHAVEERIYKDEYNAFISDEWNKLNPKGFEYQEDFDHYTETADYDKYILYFGDDVYFARNYSTVTAKEDRATLIEQIYTDRYDYYDYSDNSYDFVYSYPHMKAKLDYMAKYVKKVFGEVYWVSRFGS